MKLPKFCEWLSIRNENLGVPDIFGAREDIKNSLANMQTDPARWLSSGLQQALQKVAGNPQATSIIQEMQHVASNFLKACRDKGLGIEQRQGSVSVPRMPGPGEPGWDIYQPIYQAYYGQLQRLWQGLNSLVQ